MNFWLKGTWVASKEFFCLFAYYINIKVLCENRHEQLLSTFFFRFIQFSDALVIVLLYYNLYSYDCKSVLELVS